MQTRLLSWQWFTGPFLSCTLSSGWFCVLLGCSKTKAVKAQEKIRGGGGNGVYPLFSERSWKGALGENDDNFPLPIFSQPYFYSKDTFLHFSFEMEAFVFCYSRQSCAHLEYKLSQGCKISPLNQIHKGGSWKRLQGSSSIASGGRGGWGKGVISNWNGEHRAPPPPRPF